MKINKYNTIFFRIIFLFVLQMIFINPRVCLSQDAGKLNIGDIAPNLVLSSTNNSIQAFSFPYQNKMMLLFFWSSSVSASKQDIYKYKYIFNKYSDIGFKMCDGFDVISVALQSDKNTWNQDLVYYDLSKINNCIAQKGYNDMFVKNYKITDTKSSFLIDELGKIVAINPSIKTIISYLDSRRNSELNNDIQTKISGKVMMGNSSLSPLSNEKLIFLNEKNDTIHQVVLDENGVFLLKNISTQSSLKMVLPFSTKAIKEQSVFLTTEHGEIISAFTEDTSAYEYNLLDVEMPYLKPLNDDKLIIKKDIKEFYLSEQLFKSNEIMLTKDALLKLNPIVNTLKQNPNTQLHILTHTDSKADFNLNESISLKQSNAIANYLISKGIIKTRIKAIGKGESEILNKCKDGITCSETEHLVNRRTEFMFFPL
jgi:outer membrane protein OmpA-like peptidoglycan-associated protein